MKIATFHASLFLKITQES